MTGVEAGELVVRIVGKDGGLERSVTTAAGRATSTLRGLGRSLGLAFGGVAIAKGITTTLNLAKNFDLTMRQVGVQVDANGAQLQRMSDLALQMGQDTIYSAQEAGSAMLELAKGGLTQAQIEAGALETALTLAAAGNMDLAASAAAVVNGLGAFNLEADDAGRVATALAGAANASSADVTDMTQALAQASAQANATGLSIEEASAALAIFANNGVKGSDAGTSLKTMLQNLQPTTVTQANLMKDLGLSFVDAHGNFVDLEHIAGRLRKAMDGLSQAQRAQALRTIFGTDASRAALFLLDAGAKGVRKMTKETSNSATVQKMANVAMEGAAGAWENFTGSLETAAIKIGTKALPALTELLNWGSDMLSSADEWGPAVVDSFDGVIDVAKVLWPIVEEGIELVGDLADLWGDLPGPMQQAATTAAIAAFALPRLTGAVTAVTTSVGTNIARLQQWRAELTYTETRTKATSAMMGRFAGAAKAAAGVGGLVALTAATSESNEGLKLLESTAGGAMLGFSVGGPIGAAIGAGAGAIYGLAAATEESAVQMVNAKDAARDYADSLDQTTAAATGATRSLVLDQITKRMGDELPTVIRSLNILGLSMRDLTGFATGEHAATVRLNNAIRENANSRFGVLRSAAQQLDLQRQFLRGDREEFRAGQERVKQLQTWGDALRTFPKGVRVKLRQEGFAPNMREIVDLARQYHLTPKQVKTIIRLSGADDAKRGAKQAREALEELEATKPNLQPWLQGLKQALTGGESDARRGSEQVRDNIERPIKGTKADLSTLMGGIRTGTQNAKAAGAQGGHEAGDALGAGMYAGLALWAGQIASKAAAMVRDATAAAKAAGEMHSPSRVWRDEIGKQLALGGALGIADGTPAMTAAARKSVTDAHDAAVQELLGSKRLGRFVAEQLVAGMVGDRARVSDTARRLADLVANAYEQRASARDKRRSHLQHVAGGKGHDLEKQRAKRELRELHEQDQRDKRREHAIRQLINQQRTASMKLAREWEKNHRKLEDARNAVKDLQREQADYAKSVADAMVAAANITAAMPEGVAVTVQSITDRIREQVAEAQQFATNIATLIADGLDQAYIDQLLQAGVEGGAQQAIELVGASPAEIAALNDLMEQLQSTGSTLGQQASDYLYGAGIREAQAFVRQLEREENRIERMMRRSARAFVNELRDALDAAKGGGHHGGHHGGNAQGKRVTVGQSVAPVIRIGEINNPVPEPASQSVATRLRRLQQTGVLIDLGATSA